MRMDRFVLSVSCGLSSIHPLGVMDLAEWATLEVCAGRQRSGNLGTDEEMGC